MKNKLPDLKTKIEENLKDLIGDNITELLCVLESPLGYKIQVTLALSQIDDEDAFCDIIKFNYQNKLNHD